MENHPSQLEARKHIYKNAARLMGHALLFTPEEMIQLVNKHHQTEESFTSPFPVYSTANIAASIVRESLKQHGVNLTDNYEKFLSEAIVDIKSITELLAMQHSISDETIRHTMAN